MNQLIYPDRIRYFNSERREVAGAAQGGYQGAPEYGYLYNPPTYVEILHLDGSNTSSQNQKNQVLFTYANGAYVDMNYYVEESDTYYAVRVTARLMSKDGAIVKQLTNQGTLVSSKQVSTSISDVIAYYTPSNVSYPRHEFPEEGNYGGFAALCGQLYAPSVTASPYERPGYNTAMTFPEFRDYYSDINLNTYTNMQSINEALNEIIDAGDDTPITPIMPSEDTSEPGGGDDANPDYNPFSDPIDFPGLPTGGSAIASGFIRVYTPTASQLQSLAGVLWSDSFVDTIKKIQNDPMEAIISLHSLPMSLSSGTAECRIGNFNTGITMNTVSSQYVKRDLGSIYIPEHWASALDYSPYNTVDIYLPYVGVRSLQIDDVVGKTLRVEYNVDILSGATVVSIMCGNSVLYTYNTSLIAYHPISQSSFGPLYQSIAGAMGNVVSGAVAGGIGGAVGGALGSAINVAMSKHSTVSRGGSIGGNSGCLGNFVPYLIIHRPIQSLASGFAHFKGYPSNITATLGSVSGYTEVESVHLNGITCTDNEKAEIEALLYNGVIL